VAPIVHCVEKLYQELYLIGEKISKRNKLGLHKNIEDVCREILILSIRASLTSRYKKLPVIDEIRVQTETLKYLVRISKELSIISPKQYIGFEAKLIEISKMATNWQKYITNNPPKSGGLL